MSPDGTLPRPRKDLMSRPMDTELALFDVERGRVHTLNASAALVWEALEGARERSELVELLRESFGLGRREAEEGVEEALEAFREADLVEEG
ncbi:MAG: HPr-rel-A system PqqD family peptide chaperone [bacterium]